MTCWLSRLVPGLFFAAGLAAAAGEVVVFRVVVLLVFLRVMGAHYLHVR